VIRLQLQQKHVRLTLYVEIVSTESGVGNGYSVACGVAHLDMLRGGRVVDVVTLLSAAEMGNLEKQKGQNYFIFRSINALGAFSPEISRFEIG